MKVIQVIHPGPESRLEFGTSRTPQPGAGELLVRVQATALNRADLLQREGKYPPPPGASEILGLEMAGVVTEIGPACQGWAVGDRVCGLLPGGGYAQYAVLPASMAMRLPDAMTFEAGAALPEVFLTAYQALFWLGEFVAGESVLIHAGGSGVGTAAIQMARETRGNGEGRIFITASAAKHDVCLTLGADIAIDYRREDFATVVNQETDSTGVDLVIDFIGAPYFEKNIEALGIDGRLILLAMMGGARVDRLHLGHLFRKRIHFKASTLRNRSLAYKVKLTDSFVRDFMPAIVSGNIKPVIDRVFDWQDAEAAHRYMAANLNIGKIVLQIG